MKRSPRPLVVVVCILLVVSGRPARAGTMTGGASEWTQIMNNVALLQQVIHMIRSVVQLQQQVRYWSQNFKTFGSLGEIDQILGGFSSIIGSTQGILYAGESIAQGYKQQGELLRKWKCSHPGRVDPSRMADMSCEGFDDSGFTSKGSSSSVDAQAFRRIDDSLQRSVQKTLATLDVQVSGLDQDEDIYRKLKNRVDQLNDADDKAGLLKATIVTNELLSEMLRQLMKLRQVLLVHANAMGEFQSSDAQRRQFADVQRDREYAYTGQYREADLRGRRNLLGELNLAPSALGGWTLEPTPLLGADAPGSSPYGSQLLGGGMNAGAGTGGSPLLGGDDVVPDPVKPDLGSYVTEDGRTVIAAPGAASPPLDSYTTQGGRTVTLAPEAP